VYAVIAGLLIATGGLVAALRMALLTVVAHGSSMEPWLRSGETVLATRWWPKRWLWRGAVVLFKGYGGVVGFGEPWLIKRISHLPGETVVVRSADMPEGYPPSPGIRPGESGLPDKREFLVGPDEIFLLADNPMARDSRTWGPVPMSAVEGLVLRKLSVPVRDILAGSDVGALMPSPPAGHRRRAAAPQVPGGGIAPPAP